MDVKEKEEYFVYDEALIKRYLIGLCLNCDALINMFN